MRADSASPCTQATSRSPALLCIRVKENTKKCDMENLQIYMPEESAEETVSSNVTSQPILKWWKKWHNIKNWQKENHIVNWSLFNTDWNNLNSAKGFVTPLNYVLSMKLTKQKFSMRSIYSGVKLLSFNCLLCFRSHAFFLRPIYKHWFNFKLQTWKKKLCETEN